MKDLLRQLEHNSNWLSVKQPTLPCNAEPGRNTEMGHIYLINQEREKTG